MFMCHSLSSRTLQAATSLIYPYYGLADYEAPITESLVLSLQYRGPTPDRFNPGFTLTAGPRDSQFYCYPASYGEATFLDTDSQFEGGWDGIHYFDTGELGPLLMDVHIDGIAIPFYVYKTDWWDLGLCHWKVY